jgi:hypothetical protein
VKNLFAIVLGGLLAFAAAVPGTARARDQAAQSPEETRTDSLARAYREAIRTFKTVELEQRMAARRAIQRSGYCHTLAGVIRRNGLDALLSYIRMRLHLEFFLPQDQLVVYYPSQYKVEKIPGVPGFASAPNATTVVPVFEDRTFPADPWKKD